MNKKMTKKEMNEIRDEIDRWDQLMESPDWDENTTAMWAMAEEIVRLRKILNHICDVWVSDLYSITNEAREIRNKIRHD